MKYLPILRAIKLNIFPKPSESKILLGRWTVHNDEKLKNLSMSNSNKDNCSYNHVSIEELVIMSHNNSKPTR